MKPKALPRDKRLAIQQFVATHDQCRVILGETWLAHTVYVLGFDHSTQMRLLVGRPRTAEAARALQDRVASFISILNQKATRQ